MMRHATWIAGLTALGLGPLGAQTTREHLNVCFAAMEPGATEVLQTVEWVVLADGEGINGHVPGPSAGAPLMFFTHLPDATRGTCNLYFDSQIEAVDALSTWGDAVNMTVEPGAAAWAERAAAADARIRGQWFVFAANPRLVESLDGTGLLTVTFMNAVDAC